MPLHGASRHFAVLQNLVAIRDAADCSEPTAGGLELWIHGQFAIVVTMAGPVRHDAAAGQSTRIRIWPEQSRRPTSGPNLTLRFAWGFPGALACASLGNGRTN